MRKFVTDILHIFNEIKPFRQKFNKQLIMLSLIKVLQIAIGVSVPFLFKILIDEVMMDRQIGMLKWICTGYVLLFTMQTIIMVYQRKLSNRTFNMIVFNIKLKMWNTYMRTTQQALAKYNLGDLKNRIDADANAFSTFIEQQIIENIFSWLSIVVYGIVLFSLCWQLALVSIVIIPLSLLVARAIGKGQMKATDAYRKVWGEYEGWMFNSIQAWKEVKNLAIEKRLSRRFVDYWHKLSKPFFKQCMYIYANMSFESFKDVFINKMNMYFLGGLLIYNNQLTIGGLLVFMKYFEQLFTNVNAISNINIQLNNSKPSINRVLEILRNEIKYTGIKFDSSSFNRAIEFKNVNFKYHEAHEDVLKDVSFKINMNNRIAIVGKSGSGKTTIVKLILGLYKQNRGEIIINGCPIEDINPNCLHKFVGVVMQDSMLFNISIRDNLLLANPSASDEEIREACRMACIDDFIEALPDRYNTIIGENGVKLSGGQKQRLAIARTILAKPQIIIFDEATSSLDHISEQKIHEAIDNIAKERTVIIVAHRLSSILSADSIIVLEKGCVVGSGHHSELLGNNKAYDTLFKEQYRMHEVI